VGEAFLFLFKASKVHLKSVKWITNWYGCVLLDLNNPTQITALKMVQRSLWNWPTKFLSSMVSLHKNVFGFTILQHFSSSKPPEGFQEPLVYIGLKLATISQLPPNIWPQKGLQVLQ
jgi:hypothetical protein